MEGCQTEEDRHLLLESVGKMLANADTVLQGFELDHPAVIRNHAWDLQNFSRVREFGKTISDVDKLELVEEIYDAFDAKKVEFELKLRKGVIQSDANDRNIVICADGTPALLDFGDIVYSYTVGELAIAIAYCIVGYFTDRKSEGSDDTWLRRCAKLAQGYTLIFPLIEPELDALYDLVRARLGTSTSIGAYSSSQDPSNEYLLLHAVPGWNSISAMKRVGREGFNNVVLYQIQPKQS
jgi:Ser/Thr protein kinase RdoA (MazF antagonist)